MVKFIDFGRAYKSIRTELDLETERVRSAGDLILRKDVEVFEQNLAKYVGTKYAVGVASGTDALILSLTVAGIGQGDEVIVPSYTFRATIEAVHRVGATPVLADLGEDWRLYKTDKTKAIIPAHIAGDTMDWVPDEGIIMIEDACQAIGAKFVEGLTACYSFYPAKILGCSGDGGAIATDVKEIYDELIMLRNHYKGSWEKFGFNSRLDNLLAAELNVKIKYLPEYIERRKKIAERYDAELPEEVGRPVLRKVYQDYIIELKNKEERDALKSFLSEYEIETMENGYPFPKETPKKPLAQAYEDRTLRLPAHPHLEDSEISEVINRIKEFYYG